MTIRDYVRALRRGWLVILLSVAVFTTGAFLVSAATKKMYSASSQLFVSTTGQDSAANLAQGNTFSQARVQSYVSIVNTPAVTQSVVDDLGLKMTANQLSAQITASAPQDKVLIDIAVRNGDPQAAATISRAVANRFATVIENLERTGDTSVVKLTVVRPASVPTTPVAPRRDLNIALGIIAGLVIGAGGVLLRDRLDNTVKSAADFRDTDIAVLCQVPSDKRTPQSPNAFRADSHGVRAEAYRQLRTNLQFIDIDNPPRVIAVTSALPAEGKSTTALNLAAALAEGGNRVCLVETDLRKPTMAKYLGLVGNVGLTSVLIGRAEVEDVLQNGGQNLAVLTSGEVPPNPSELLASENVRKLIGYIAESVDYVILDAAPLLPVADGAEVAALADATLLVCRARKTTHDQVSRALDSLQRVGERPVGVVLTLTTKGSGDADYGYYYGSYRPEPSKSSKRGQTAAVDDVRDDLDAGGDAEAATVR